MPWSEQLSHLPVVRNRAGRAGVTFEALADRYEALLKEPLLIRAVLGTPYVPAESDGAIHLDGLLSFAVLQDFPEAPTFREDEGCVIPLPIVALWISPDGLPLWATSDLLPQGAALRGREYWHGRYPSGRADISRRVNADTGAGRWKESRIPLPTLRAPELRGMALGHRETIEALLAYVSHVGKKPAQGFGRILRWEVLPLQDDPVTVREAIIQARPVPVDYFGVGQAPLGNYVLSRGWCPPYWFMPWHRACRVPR